MKYFYILLIFLFSANVSISQIVDINVNNPKIDLPRRDLKVIKYKQKIKAKKAKLKAKEKRKKDRINNRKKRKK